MQETNYKIYLYPRWLIINAAVSLAALIGCLVIMSNITSTTVRLGLLFLTPVFGGIMIMNLIPLFSIRKPCIVCTAAGIVIYLRLQPDQRTDHSYFRTLHEFIPWENIHGIYLLQKKHWYNKPASALRINYNVTRGALPAYSHIDIFVNQLDVHPESMYNTLMAYYSKHKPVNH